MCLLTLADRDLSCNHPECQKKDDATEGISSFSKCNFKNVIGSAGSLMKRARPTPDAVPNSQALFDEVMKKFKKDDDDGSKGQAEVNKNPQGAQPNIANDNNLFLQKLLMANQANQPKYNLQNSQYLSSYYQSNPNQILQNNNIPLNYLQNPTVMMGYSGESAQYPYNSSIMSPPMNMRKPDSNMSDYFPDFCIQIVTMMSNQSKIIQNLKEKNDIIIESLNYVVSELQELKKGKEATAKEKILEVAKVPQPQQLLHGIAGENISSNELLYYLYGKEKEFTYNLEITSELELPLYRERNFSFAVCLKDKQGNIVPNTNRIPLSIALYSSENPPKFIENNTSGQKILKGLIEIDLIKGEASFEKIQIREVSSHFRNGWFFMIVYPKMPSFGHIIYGNNSQQNMVDFTTIKPLILEKLIVKAKKLTSKEKDEAKEEIYEDN